VVQKEVGDERELELVPPLAKEKPGTTD